MVFNNTSRIQSCETGIILPQSDKVLTPQKVCEKIEKVKHQIHHLEHNVAHRNTHGGPVLPAKKYFPT